MQEWEEASSSVVHVAQRLIDQYHPWLADARIGFVFRKEAQRSKGKLVLAQAQLVNAKLQVYLEYDFLIWVSKEDWEGQLTAAQREALIDHELSHCVKNLSNDRWDIRPHDVQEFWHILDRHGLWNRDLETGRKAMEKVVQGQLPIDPPRTGSVTAVSVKTFQMAREIERETSDAH
jgi:hypothetical protein